MRKINVLPLRARAGLVLCAALLSACATGQGSFIAGSGGGGGDDGFFDDEGFFDENAPDLLAAGGNALLRGGRSRNRGAAGLLGQTVNGGGPLGSPGGALDNTLADALNGAPLTGPLLALNGRRTVLLGLPVTTSNLGARTQTNIVVGASVNPSNASTQLLISLGGAVAAPAGAGGATAPTAPINVGTPPVSSPPLIAPGVPGSVPLTSLLPLVGGATPGLPGAGVPGH